MGKLLSLPDEIGLVSLRTLGPLTGRLRCYHKLNALGIEALAAAVHLDAEVFLTSPSPRLQESLKVEGMRVQIVTV